MMTNVFIVVISLLLLVACLAKSIRSGFKRLRREVVSFCANLFLKSRVSLCRFVFAKCVCLCALLSEESMLSFCVEEKEEEKRETKNKTKPKIHETTRKSTRTKILSRNQSINQRSSYIYNAIIAPETRSVT